MEVYNFYKFSVTEMCHESHRDSPEDRLTSYNKGNG